MTELKDGDGGGEEDAVFVLSNVVVGSNSDSIPYLNVFDGKLEARKGVVGGGLAVAEDESIVADDGHQFA